MNDRASYLRPDEPRVQIPFEMDIVVTSDDGSNEDLFLRDDFRRMGDAWALAVGAVTTRMGEDYWYDSADLSQRTIRDANTPHRSNTIVRRPSAELRRLVERQSMPSFEDVLGFEAPRPSTDFIEHLSNPGDWLDQERSEVFAIGINWPKRGTAPFDTARPRITFEAVLENIRAERGSLKVIASGIFIWALMDVLKPTMTDVSKVAMHESAGKYYQKYKIEKEFKRIAKRCKVNGNVYLELDGLVAMLKSDANNGLYGDLCHVQDGLRILGLNPGKADGKMGPDTRVAMEVFASKWKLPAAAVRNGHPTPLFLETLARALDGDMPPT